METFFETFYSDLTLCYDKYEGSWCSTGSVARLREIMVAALHKMGRDKEANLVLELRRSDVLGIKPIGEF